MRTRIVTITIGAASVILAIILFGFDMQEKKSAFIDSVKVYNEFKLTKELKSKYERVSNTRQIILDSLKIELIAMESQMRANDEHAKAMYEKKINEYKYKADMFLQDNQRLNSVYTEQVMNQLNQYIKEYGEKRGYDYIYGADGSGSLLYANQDNDISDEIIEYINLSYQNEIE